MRIECGAASGRWKITNGRIVTPDGIVDGEVTIEDGVIVRVGSGQDGNGTSCRTVDAAGMWVLPGLIDTHSDAIEKELYPRKASALPLDIAFYELERKLAAQGITTMYHSFSMWGENAGEEARKNDNVIRFIRMFRQLQQERCMIRHKFHMRLEMSNLGAIPVIEELLSQAEIDLLSFMDHTPGQGQFRNEDIQLQYIMSSEQKSEAEAREAMDSRRRQQKASDDVLTRLAHRANNRGVRLASHDDESLDKLDRAEGWGAAISEFPVDLQVALEARRRGIYVTMGAPNVLLGRSHSGNLSALEAIREGAVDILCSDYYPPSLIQAVFTLFHAGYALPDCVNMVSLHPARALGLDGKIGSIEEGKAADLLLVQEYGNRPFIHTVAVDGHVVCSMNERAGIG